MIFDKNGNITIITQENESTVELVKKIEVLYERYKNNNIIVNLTSLEKVHLSEIVEFLQISNTHRKARHSFVIVTSRIDLDETPDEIVVVPTLQEAYDIIEMEEIERDLGF
ncbi:ribonuclease Z [Psychroserpens sp.]|uniref:ribonuclease Z n=1 Tax=Psychroserpens sp. TaxID=2020870 RepID=UPI001B0014D5|nr:ribonuclease Z [Psychroserpens sp.]MBO6607268.1 ribonuclease Z [Psychroserpens sp.]MBO6632087.1 ribonuclease Z [Psychroserpens sp.]MBO6654656.1 ribonuclease Z [Psychroserpens sp.]MBO6680997.1 ribonuclease Z [Psychroserpens sp.]MBO6750048.1 ribonuclease Z [Psychroserpens sp.]